MRYQRELILAIIVLTVLLILPEAYAYAAQTGDAPWDTAFTKLKAELTGPIPFIVGVAATVGSLSAIIVGRHEMSGVITALLFIVFIISVLFNIVAFFTWIGGTAALV
jgi:type IV secretory pathway VirB2 component (pilin)